MDFGTPDPPSQPVRECGKCEELPGVIPCDCGEHFCEGCHRKHLLRNPTHRQNPHEKYYSFWSSVTDVLSVVNGEDNHSDTFKKDETAKWFGLVTKARYGGRVSVIVETPRLAKLVENSVHAYENSPGLQFPSITSFVGFTGAGKSVLIRSLIYHSAKDGAFGSFESPVPGAKSGEGVLLSTTGEVNLYAEPSTFGTKSPIFFADCEGIMGSEPLAAKHQKDWAKFGRKYRVQVPMDRRTVVKKIYPRFLYIFSDVVCYVTRDHRSWADTAVRLLEWSSIGAQTTINQDTLPALIIILNAPIVENTAWVSDDLDAVTRDFFRVIENELEANDGLRALASKYGDTSMLELFKRSYSSVYVHYIPLQGNGKLGDVDIVYKQTERLLSRIKSDTARVQNNRAGSLTRFDNKQLSTITDLAFKHLAAGSAEPFDFGQCRQHGGVPETLDSHFGEYLRHCFKSNIRLGLGACVSTLGSAIFINTLAAKVEGKYWINTLRRTIFVPSVIFNSRVREACQKAMDSFRDENSICAYIDPESGTRCINTKVGHAKGHQSKTGAFMRSGGYIEEEGSITTALFLSSIEGYIGSLIQKFTAIGHSNLKIWRQLAAKEHRKNIERLRLENVYPKAGRAETDDPFSTTTICYGCFFRHSEYLLPCGHTICETCIRANSTVDAAMKYTGKHTLEGCVVCGTSIGPGWPYEVRLRPQLSGPRILSLDGGGVRGIVQLTTLQRLESLIGLGLPIGFFFDLIVGTSTGGFIALALGIQGRSANSLVDEFKAVCHTGFSGRRQNTGQISSFFSWMSLKSAYFTQNLQEAFQAHFQKIGDSKVFGLRNHCRVGVTTTVMSEAKLICNYKRGGIGKYLTSDLILSDAARCTSAAPLYFDPKMHDGNFCRDGGLKESNPVHLAITESKGIWGPRSNYDMVLSVGSGLGSKPQPDSPYNYLVKPQWLWKLFCPFLDKMNGEEEWIKYRESGADRIVERSSRLNVFFSEEVEPSFDDLAKMKKMEADAKSYTSFEDPILKSPFSPISSRSELSVLETLADRLRATLFFLEVKSIDKSDGFIIIVKGIIRCRLGPDDAGFSNLLGMVSSFRVSQEVIKPNTPPSEYFGLEIEFSHESIDEAIRIDVNFGKRHWVAISGSPMTIKEIMEQWDSVGALDDDGNSENRPTSDSDIPENSIGGDPPVPTSTISDSGFLPTAGPSGNDLFDRRSETNYDQESIDDIDMRTLRTDDASDFSFDASY
ncbi:hypothetical protein TWF506_009995 [Arthrobotrys conoides]|uniref:PNPLA domain-containing protein n=1 Tax=Arthrobotrys conoides TaxID=74498 RepID=A0AAN8NM75_9PEZI